jgi:hypothetical protein
MQKNKVKKKWKKKTLWITVVIDNDFGVEKQHLEYCMISSLEITKPLKKC